ncbi:MAG: hypothetical protein Kow0075_11950 [Salibacteraceae bacterium]
MHNQYLIPLIAALIGVLLKLSYFRWFYPDPEFDNYVRFGYLLLLLLSVFLSLRFYAMTIKKTEFGTMVKEGMKSVSIFALILSGFTYLYYEVINPEYFAGRISDVASQVKQMPNSEQAVKTAEFVFNSFTHTTITLVGIMVAGFFYVLILALIQRSSPGFLRNL